MTTARVVTGDDVQVIVDLKKDGAAFVIPAGAAVKACISHRHGREALSDTVTVLSTAPGSDWSQSRIVVHFEPADTQSIQAVGAARLEIQVDDGIKTTWFVPCDIVLGTIA